MSAASPQEFPNRGLRFAASPAARVSPKNACRVGLLTVSGKFGTDTETQNFNFLDEGGLSLTLDPTKHADWEIAEEAESRMKTCYQLAEELGLAKE